MRLDSARNLKQLILKTILAPLTTAEERLVKSFASGTTSIETVPEQVPSLAIGIVAKRANEFQVAIRCQRKDLINGKEVETIKRKANNEVNVRFIGPVRKRAAKRWNQKRVRPLQIGLSCGHFKITAGTLGCFVKLRNSADSKVYILSNNHVLANENKAKIGDVILQPGNFDGGKNPADVVAALTTQVKLKKSTANLIDAAVAELNSGVGVNLRMIKGMGKLAGLGAAIVDEGTLVAKLGRTTGLTRGRVTAFELDNVVVEFGLGYLRFDNQIEIEGADDRAFSEGGDSGSLIVEESTRLAIALLFAGSDAGGTNGKGLTYGNPIHVVLDSMKIELA